MGKSETAADAAVAEQLRTIERGLVAAWIASDRAFVERTLADDWSVIDVAGRVLTKPEVLAEGFDTGERQLTSGHIDEINVRSFGDWAVVTGRTHAAGRYRGAEVKVTLRFTDVFAQRDGRWQVIASQATLLKE